MSDDLVRREGDLKHCPFCGGKAEHSIGKTGDGKPWHYVECVDCGAVGPTLPYADHNISVIEHCTEAWNTRADRSAELEAKLEKAREEGFWTGRSCGGAKKEIDAALAELKGQDDE